MITVAAPQDASQIAANLRAVAHSLSGIAATVGRESAAATLLVRRAAEQAGDTAVLAAELDSIATLVAANIRLQVELLTEGRNAAASNIAVVDGLGHAAERIGAISSMIGEIAGRSRLLALNARIEAARTGDGGRGFDVVANEMTMLAQSTRAATRDIDERADAIHGDVVATREAFTGAVALVEREQALIVAIVDAVDRQKRVAGDVARLTGGTTASMEDTAVAIGRVSSAAVTVDLLARQVVRAADRLAA